MRDRSKMGLRVGKEENQGFYSSVLELLQNSAISHCSTLEKTSVV